MVAEAVEERAVKVEGKAVVEVGLREGVKAGKAGGTPEVDQVEVAEVARASSRLAWRWRREGHLQRM